MIVVCPNCSKRYMLDDSLLPKEGRQVRCIACEHVWRQAPAIPSLIIHPPLKELKGETLGMGHPPAEKRSRWLGWTLALAIVFSCFSFLTFGRDIVVKFLPQTERFYDLMGLPVNAPGAGLSITQARSLTHQDGPIEMIQVAGDITNTSNRVRSIPPLKIEFIGAPTLPKCAGKPENECVLDYWEHRLSEGSLLPGETLHFETAPRPRIEGTSHILVEF